MKSAYELAMERLSRESPTDNTPLSDAAKEQLAEIDRKFQAKIAEREVFLNRQILEARRSGDRQALDQLETQLRNERIRLNDERDAAKDKVRAAARAT
jgi:hypothetical protein